jgi:MinD-like ATPase involved in chromosome partitioning or flagellar assembly
MSIDSLLHTQDRIDAIQFALESHKAAWVDYLGRFTAPCNTLLVVRDWHGRFHIGLPGNKKIDKLSTEQRLPLKEALRALQSAAEPLAYAPDFYVYSEELFDAEALWCSSDKVLWDELDPIPIYWIERQANEKIWAQSPPVIDPLHPLRIVFFGIKGGVGRSSALSATAYHLLSQGKKVLVLDADFESPGVSATLLADNLRPDYGLLDWFALDALDQQLAVELIQTRRVVERSGLDQIVSGEGTIWVAPSFGRQTQDYVGKLGRLYQDVGDQGYVQRFKKMLTSLEAELEPDVVLIDSRAGVDDTAALALTQLDAYGLLFATHGRATWAAYAHLFKHWQHFAHLQTGGEDFRSKLRIISALTPVDSAYDRALQDASYSLFLEHLYESLAADQMEGEGFNYGADDPDAPHHPWRVRWDDVLRHFDLIQNPAQLDSSVFQKTFGELVELIDQLVAQSSMSEAAGA